MIPYNSGSFGWRLLFRIHGSAVFKALVPSLMSTCIYFALRYAGAGVHTLELLDHPYPIGAMIAGLTFLLAFRANFAYNRYWESFTAVHQFHSKLLDAAVQMAAHHLQAAKYDPIKPPAFGHHPAVQDLQRQRRQRVKEYTFEELREQLEEMGVDDEVSNTILDALCCSRRKNKNAAHHDSDFAQPKMSTKMINSRPTSFSDHDNNNKHNNKEEEEYQGPVSTKADLSKFRDSAVITSTSARPRNARCFPSLFMEESAHLFSLLSAVAFSTLRTDLEDADTPLTTFTAGRPWPHVDPDERRYADIRKDWLDDTNNEQKEYNESSSWFWNLIRFLFGVSRTAASRTLYNAARPFRVVGGVSDGEVALLQAARGPKAKVALCFLWLTEFMSREHLQGSTGKVAPPIVSRSYQFNSDAMLGYNQAFKIAYIPFPFPHAQITSLIVYFIVGFSPVLMLSYIPNFPWGVILNFAVVSSFAGLHEVAREVENPFLNVPNDLPLNNYQAQFNEALITTFTGYHPDGYWEVATNVQHQQQQQKQQQGGGGKEVMT